ncbi:MAG: type II toxin-antitoxin system RelE/ParE family toxin [Candidatus Woesearchaeota archaeon]|nr:type II toxin-antitoxin system RelE/ParE family toxin [Candidatus Woesearchaeota archaeon]
MSWEISWHPKAGKYVEKLPHSIAKRILDKFDEVAQEPFRYLEHFEGEGYKLRIGEYRALIDVDFEKKILKVRIFDLRERIY